MGVKRANRRHNPSLLPSVACGDVCAVARAPRLGGSEVLALVAVWPAVSGASPGTEANRSSDGKWRKDVGETIGDKTGTAFVSVSGLSPSAQSGPRAIARTSPKSGKKGGLKSRMRGPQQLAVRCRGRKHRGAARIVRADPNANRGSDELQVQELFNLGTTKWIIFAKRRWSTLA